MPADNSIVEKGFITRERWLIGRTSRQMARLLGFSLDRMALGARVYALKRLPRNDEFQFAGYTHWPNGEPKGGREVLPPNWIAIDAKWMRGPDERRKDLVRSTWTQTGPDRLVKVVPNIAHKEGETKYPPGDGVEQWRLDRRIEMNLVADLGTDEVYRPR
jgi:hypothetical protein